MVYDLVPLRNITMQLFIRPTLNVGKMKSSALRTMSSLTPGQVLTGAKWILKETVHTYL